MDDRATGGDRQYVPTLGPKFRLDTPRTDSIVHGELLKIL